MRPRCLLAGSSLSSNSFRKPSIPCVSTLLSPFRNPLHKSPTAPMVKADAARHGPLGASGCSSGRIGVGVGLRATCEDFALNSWMPRPTNVTARDRHFGDTASAIAACTCAKWMALPLQHAFFHHHSKSSTLYKTKLGLASLVHHPQSLDTGSHSCAWHCCSD